MSLWDEAMQRLPASVRAVLPWIAALCILIEAGDPVIYFRLAP